MRRRSFFMLAATAPVAAAKREDPAQTARIPTEPDELNAFAAEYDRYILDLRDGVINLKQWRRVAERWAKMTR